MEERCYIVYKYTNLLNGKVYIGQTKQRPNVRAKCDGKGYKDSPKFWNAIKKYGWDNFKFEILAQNLLPEEADKLEQEYIETYKSNHKVYGYNISGGGQVNHIMSKETIEKIRLKKIERDKITPKRHWTKEEIKKQVEARLKSPFFWEGRKRSAEKRRGIPLAEERKRKISLANKGRKPSQYTIQKSIEANNKPIKQYDINNHKYIQTFSSITQAVNFLFDTSKLTDKQIASKISNICGVCRGKSKTAFGYYWEYNAKNSRRHKTGR